MTVEIIHESFQNGQNTQAVSQIRKYGVSKFWTDYANYLEENFQPEGAWYHLTNAIDMFVKIPRFSR